MKVTTPELLWHGGGNEQGKPDPIYSIDIHPNYVLATAGVDGSVPPKGAVRLWKLDSKSDNPEFIFELADHQSVVNTLKFSPCGKYLATASDRLIVVYFANDVSIWSSLNDTQQIEKYWFNPSLDEIFDISWSPDSTHIIAGALNARAEIIALSNKEGLLLTGHTSYIQGVAWDPLNQMVITQSNDRSCKMHAIKSYPNKKIKLASRGHGVLRMNAETSRHLFADATVPCFFRRPTFSPDGSLIFLPTGTFRPNHIDGQLPTVQTFCTYIISRHNFLTPLISLAGLEEPSIAVRCSPVLYKLVENSTTQPMIKGIYRIVFCVLTISTIYIYDTQHSHPIARLSGCHFATINDASWTPDGNMLIVCSSDCYITFIRFEPGELGVPIPSEDIPLIVKESHPCMYGYERVEIDKPSNSSLLNDIKDSMISDFISSTPCDLSQENPMQEADIIDCLSEDSDVYILSSADEPTFSSQLSGYPESDSVIGVSFLNDNKPIATTMKKRRVTPSLINTSVDTPLSPPNNSNKENNLSDMVIDQTSPMNECKNITPNQEISKNETKQKKRIAPMLISSDISNFHMITSSYNSSNSIQNNSSSSSSSLQNNYPI